MMLTSDASEVEGDGSGDANGAVSETLLPPADCSTRVFAAVTLISVKIRIS